MSDALDIDALVADLDPTAKVVVAVLQQQNQQLLAITQQQSQQIAALTTEVAALRQALFGRKSEVMPDIRRRPPPATPEEAAEREQERLKKRAKGRARQKALPVQERVLDVPKAQRVCPTCAGTDLHELGEGLVTEQIEYVPAQLVRLRFVRRKYACRCGEGIVTAAPPPTVGEGVMYGPGLHAQVAVAKCADSLPLYRQAKAMKRAGVGIGRSSLGDVFHRTAEALKPLYDRLVEQVALASHVSADETPLPVQKKGGCHRGFVWTFIAGKTIVYTYSRTRSGKTPLRILGDSEGVLQVDGYSGYNTVSTPSNRTRAGCWAHVRRYFFKALETAKTDANEAMNRVGKLYGIERTVQEKKLTGSAAHLGLRETESRPIVTALFKWLVERQSHHPPKSPMGKAITYALNQRASLEVFLSDASVAIDNNASERALRVVAVGRKNFLFAGNDGGATNLAILQTMVSSAQSYGLNPFKYLRDVLVRLDSHPNSQIDDLLPEHWKSTEP